MPAIEDMVIGTVTEKHAESYRVDIGTVEHARLPATSFEGATRRNKPNIQVGSLIYCRIGDANKFMEPELTCISPHFKKEWVTGESIFGELVGGYCFNISIHLARKLLSEDCFILKKLGEKIAFEIAIGANGRVWVNSKSPTFTVIISNAILNSETMLNEEMERMVNRLVSALE